MEFDRMLQSIFDDNYKQREQQLKTPINLKSKFLEKHSTLKAYKCIVESINHDSDQKIIKLFKKDYETRKKASLVLSPKPYKYCNHTYKTSRLKGF